MTDAPGRFLVRARGLSVFRAALVEVRDLIAGG